jgi:uncharacterized damage-inducible protein DinB
MLLVGFSGAMPAQADCGYAELLKTHWTRTRRMITNIVAAMPEDKYDFRPVKEVRSFREMSVHLIQDGFSHMGWAAGRSREESEKMSAKYESYKTRAEILKGLEEMFDQGERDIATITDQNAHEIVAGMRSEPQTRFEAALVAFEDQMGHYGNMVVYLRLNGIVPPSTANAAQERQQNQERLRQMGVPTAPSGQSGQPAEGEHTH